MASSKIMIIFPKACGKKFGFEELRTKVSKGKAEL